MMDRWIIIIFVLMYLSILIIWIRNLILEQNNPLDKKIDRYIKVQELALKKDLGIELSQEDKDYINDIVKEL